MGYFSLPRRSSLVLVGTLLAGSINAEAKDLEPFVFGLPTALSYNYSIYTAAMKLGFFEEEGLEATLQGFQGGSALITQVANKGVDVGSSSAEPIIIASETNPARLPITFIYNQNRDYNWQFVVPDGSPIKTLADLKGKKIGVGSLANSHMPVTRVMLAEAGLTEGVDYDFIAIGTGAPAFKALLDGSVDAYNTWTANIGSFEALGNKLQRLPIGERYTGLFQTGFFTHSDYITERPDFIKGFGRAYTKATIVCREVPGYCLRSFWEQYPDLKPRDISEDDAIAALVPALQISWNHYFAFPEGQERKFGSYPEGSWEELVSVLHEGGALKEANVKVDELYTNEFVEAFNDFDQQSLKALIETLR